MTLAALFSYKDNDSIFMLGDGLISSEIESPGNFIMPGRGKVGRPKSSYGYFEGIEQKLNIVGADLAFVWSGQRDLAHKFAKEIFEIYDDDLYDFEKLKLFLDNWLSFIKEDDRKEIKLIVACRVDGEYKTWRHGAEDLHGYKHFKKLWITGTGRNNFLDTIGNEMDIVDTDDQATGHAMNILNKYYYDDLFVQSNYSEAFGGMYELASCSQSGIEKLSDVFITTIHIDATQLDRGFAIPLTFLKYDVIDGLSVIREVKAVGIGDDESPNFENFGHAYLPLIPTHREKALKVSDQLQIENEFYNSKIIGDMKAKHTIVMLQFVDAELELKIPLYYRKADRNTPVELSHKDGKVSIFLAQEILDTINRNIEKYINRETSALKSNEEL